MSNSLIAIATGGASICIELLNKRYRVCIADIQESKATEFVKEQQSVYGEENVTTIRCDVSNESNYANLFGEILKNFKRVDVLMDAGIIMEQNPSKCLEVNLLGTLIGCQTALKYMYKTKGGNGGVVVNMSSVSAPRLPAYVASKNGVIGLTRSFGLLYHYDKKGIIFAALCPFAIDTELLKTAIKTFDPTMDFMRSIDKISPESTAKGVMKILEDKINGSTAEIHVVEL